MSKNTKQLIDELDALIEIKERCESDEDDDYIDNEIKKLLVTILRSEE
jgi:hypothetical protein